MKPHSVKPALKPRKTPRQARSAATVDVILEAAAHILERSGFDGYSTNAIAQKAGVSIGSLYQYFPTRDAITCELIHRQNTQLTHEIAEIGGMHSGAATLEKIIDIAVENQLQRPALNRILDLEEARLSPESSHNAESVSEKFQQALTALGYPPHGVVVGDLIAIIRGMVDAAGQKKNLDQPDLSLRIQAAVFGYLEKRWG